MSTPLRRSFQGSQPRGSNLMDDEEENSQDSVEQAALEAGRKDDNIEQDSLMLEDLEDDGFPAVDDDDDEVPMGRGARSSSNVPIPGTTADMLFDETDSTLNTPFGSPLSAIGSFSSIQKWTGEVKKMLLDDQQKTESRTKGWIYPLPEMISTITAHVGASDTRRAEAEGFTHVEGTYLGTESDFDIMPSAEELAEKYSNELIDKERSILQKDAKILEMEKLHRELKSNLEQCQKELRQKTATATSGVEKLKQTLEEKDKCIMETSERLRKVTESYNSSEKRWKEQQDYLEKQIQKLKTQLDENKSRVDEERDRLMEFSREKQSLEEQLEKSKEENEFLKQQFAEERETLEDELKSLRDEKSKLEKQLREEIETLKSKLALSEQAIETALSEKESIKAELESQEEKNRVLISDIDVLKEKEEIISQQQNDKLVLEDAIATLKQEKETLQESFCNEKYELELQVQTLQEELNEAKEQGVEEAPINFFKQETLNTASVSDSDWLETRKSMENRIAELELEKGNLLLQLVDVDDDEQQENRKDVATNTAENQLEQLENIKEALLQSEERMACLERELEESKNRDTQRIETAMNTIAWEEKFEILQKENESLTADLGAQRRAGDELSSRYEELERKCAELEMNKPSIENIVELDKCDGWSDDTPQLPDEGDGHHLPDEGFTDDPQITELKEALEGKEREIEQFLERQNELERKLSEEGKLVAHFENMFQDAESEKTITNSRLEECTKQLEIIRQELIEKSLQLAEVEQASAVVKPTVDPAADGWADDAPVLLNEAVTEDNQTQIAELQEELSKKDQELTTKSEKCKTLEDKLKKALKALKQKNDKMAEMKQRLGEDPMSMSTVSPTLMETSVVVQEPLVTKSTAYVCGNELTEQVEQLKKACDEKELKIKELEDTVKSMKESPAVEEVQEPLCTAFNAPEVTAQRDNGEISRLRNELSQLANTLDSKNEEIEQLMKTCEDMEKSVDEKVEMLNDCVSKKDEEVKQAIAQYEDILKNATLNVSQLTKELEEKIREINVLQLQLQESQESLLETQNEFEGFKAETLSSQFSASTEKEHRIEEQQQLVEQLRYELGNAQAQLSDALNNQQLINEALDRAESEKKQLREESLCIQNDYGSKSRELQVQISQLIDQLNERETAISVMETRLKESDEMSSKVANEIRLQLDEKAKALEQVEQSLFVKTEECLRVEERLRESEERYRQELQTKVKELEDQHRVALQSYAMQTSDDLERTCEQLAKKNSESSELLERCNYFQNQASKLQEDYNMKYAEVQQLEQSLQQIETLKGTIQSLEGTVASYTHALNSANADLAAKAEEIKNLQTICSQYEEKSYSSALAQDDVQRTLQETQAALAQCQHELSNYYNELQNSKMEAETLRTSSGDLQETVNRLNGELRDSKAEAGQLASQIENMTNQFTRYQDIESNLNRYLEDLNSATEELGQKNLLVREMEKTTKAQETQIQSLRAQLETKNQDIFQEEIAEQVSKVRQETNELVANSKKEYEKQMKELYDELEEKNKEIGDLRFELDEGVEQERSMKKNIEGKDQEIQALRAEVNDRDRDIYTLRQQVEQLAAQPTLSQDDEPLVQRLQYSEAEKQLLERKIDLLQSKLAEVEASEVKCYEDFSRLKILRTELEMDNLRMSAELEQLRRSFQDGDNDPKYKSMENQIVLMSKTLEDRDKLCRDLMKNIGELQQAHDALQVRANDLQTQQLPSQYYEGSLEAAVLEQDRQIFSLKIDIDREKKIRELYEGLLFLATSKKQFESTKNTGAWFGLRDLFSSPSPPSPPRPSSSTRSSVSSSMMMPPSLSTPTPHFSPYASTPGRPITPVSPATAFSSSLFENSGQQPPISQLADPNNLSLEDIRPEIATSTAALVDPTHSA